MLATSRDDFLHFSVDGEHAGLEFVVDICILQIFLRSEYPLVRITDWERLGKKCAVVRDHIFF